METALPLWECSVPPSPLPLTYLVFAGKLGPFRPGWRGDGETRSLQGWGAEQLPEKPLWTRSCPSGKAVLTEPRGSTPYPGLSACLRSCSREPLVYVSFSAMLPQKGSEGPKSFFSV